MTNTYHDIMKNYTPQEWAEFAFFSANIQHVQSESRLSAQLELYRRHLEYIEWQAGFDLQEGAAAPFSDALQQCLDEGSILVSFHFGQYRLIPLSLLACGYRVCILVSRDVYAGQLDYYQVRLRPDWFANLQFVLAEDPRLFFQLRQYSQAGYILLCYVDGASGVHKQSVANSVGTLEVSLGHVAVRVRSGFAAMAYLLQRPIGVVYGPIAMSGRPAILGVDALYRPQAYRCRTDYVEHTVKGIYAQLSQALIRHPVYWECWTYLHERMPIEPRLDQWPSADRYIPLQKEGGSFLLDKALYRLHPVDNSAFARLMGAAVAVY